MKKYIINSPKRKKRIVFIEPIGENANVFDNFMKLPLMGTLYLGTILYEHGYEVEIYNENVLGRKIKPSEINADIVCISALTINVNRAKYLCMSIKQLFPDIRIIAGGIHASLIPEEFNGFVDQIVKGEAEGNIIDIIEGKYKKKIVQGKPLNNLNDLPLVNYSLLKNYKTMNVIPIMTSRGCPFDCNFCTVTKIFGKRFRYLTPKRVIDEIKNALSYFNSNYIFFYDDNLTANKKRMHSIADLILSEKLNIIWTAQVRSDIARDQDLLLKMFKAGCERFYIGFESIDDTILKSFHKSQTRRDIENSITIIHDAGINIHGMFMLGEDNDTNVNIEETVNFAINFDIETVQFMILTPFPGTEIYYQLKNENRLLHLNWDYYDAMHAVFIPKNMTALNLQLSMIRAYKKFYSLDNIGFRLFFLAFNFFYDALVWNFRRIFRLDMSNIYSLVGAKYIIKKYLSINREYLYFLERFERNITNID